MPFSFRFFDSSRGPTEHLVGAARTKCTDSIITDSAAGATAYAIDRRRNNHVLVGCNGTKPLFEELDTLELSLSELARLWERNALVFTECPDLEELLEFRKDISTPPFLHRIWECSDIPSRYNASLLSWVNNSPTKYVFLWTRNVREAFISQILGSQKLKLYQRLIPGAYRADLFKYILMYFIGGVYSDMDAFLAQNISALEYLRTGTSMAMDLTGPRLLPGAILVSPPRDPVFRCAMGEVFDHSTRKRYFEHEHGGLDISGPGVLGECVKHVTGQDDLVFQDSIRDLKEQGYRLFPSLLLPDGSHAVQLLDNSNLIVLQQGGAPYDKSSRTECDPGEHYSVLYKKRAVYANEDNEKADAE